MLVQWLDAPDCIAYYCGPPSHCWHCSKLTHWIDLAFEAYLCPGPCSTAKWKEFQEAVSVLPEIRLVDLSDLPPISIKPR